MRKKKFRKFQFKKRFLKKSRRGFVIMLVFEILLVLILEIFEVVATRLPQNVSTFKLILSHVCYYIIQFVNTSPICLLCYIIYLVGVIHKYQLRYIYYLIDYNHTLNLFQFKTIIREIHRTIVKTSRKFMLVLIFNSIIPLIILMMVLLFDGNGTGSSSSSNNNDSNDSTDTTSDDTTSDTTDTNNNIESSNDIDSVIGNGTDIWRDWHYLWLWFSLSLYVLVGLFQLYICAGVTSACDELIVRIYHRQSIAQSFMLHEAKATSPTNKSSNQDIARKLSDVLGPALNQREFGSINVNSHNNNRSVNGSGAVNFNNQALLSQLSSHPDIFFLVHYVKDMKMGWYLGAFRVDRQFLAKVVYALVALCVFLAVNYLSDQQTL